jgi:rare lipoprotein A
MSSNSFVSRNNASVGARAVGGKLAALLAACIVCGVAGSGNTAANPSDDFGTIPFLAPASPAPVDDPTAPSFKERFDVSQPSRVHEILAGLTYYLPQEELTTASLPPQRQIVAAGDAIVGIASTYNPPDPNDRDAGNEETASGEKYDVNGWTAAIRTDLRTQFGGVRFGRNYQPTFALVQGGDKQIIVKINDVGPLRPGRIIDLNERAMRYFDPTRKMGLINNVTVTPLAGQDWALGPIDDDRPVSVASLFDQLTR